MDREIKFRAINKTTEIIDGVEFETTEIITQENSGLKNWEILARYSEVEQYTGLKDSTGKEIYEGDIPGAFEVLEIEPEQFLFSNEKGVQIHETTNEEIIRILNEDNNGKYGYSTSSREKFWCKNQNGTYAAMDNTTGDALYEHFANFEDVKRYLIDGDSVEDITKDIAKEHAKTIGFK